ncbi:MAG TPA: NADPH-dependent F420 reductase [Bacillota bacterium]
MSGPAAAGAPAADRPRVGVLGGTGELGLGLAGRWARAGVEVVIGSRDEHRAREAARSLAALPGATAVEGLTNPEAAAAAEVVIIAVPAAAQPAVLTEAAAHLRGKIVVDATVPLAAGDPTRLDPPPEGSAAQRADRILAAAGGARVVSGFHTVPARLLQDLDRKLAMDVLLCGDDDAAKARVAELARIIGLRPIDCGPLTQAATLERLTPLIIGISKRYRRRHVGLTFTGLPDEL